MSFEGIFDLARKQERLNALDAIVSAPQFWADATQAKYLMRECVALRHLFTLFDGQQESLDEAFFYVGMANDEPEALGEAQALLGQVESGIKSIEVECMFMGEHDATDAFLLLSAEAVEQEPYDWVSMLLHMYTRYCHRKGWRVDIIDQQRGQGAELVRATLHVRGVRVYGHLKAERGRHTLSYPCLHSKGGKRTYGAVVGVVHEVHANGLNVDPTDLRIDHAYFSRGFTLHAERPMCATRVTHIPTGVVATCQSERSQFMNLAKAMTLLNAKLHDLGGRVQGRAVSSPHIRSYTPQHVEDHRTGYTALNSGCVFDGDLDALIEAHLQTGL